MIAITDKVETPEIKEEIKPTFTKEGSITVTSDEGTNFLKGKINEIFDESTGDLKKNDVKLARIVEWANQKGAKSVEDAMWAIRDLANHLGSPEVGESKLSRIYNWIYLSQVRDEAETKLKGMENARI